MTTTDHAPAIGKIQCILCSLFLSNLLVDLDDELTVEEELAATGDGSDYEERLARQLSKENQPSKNTYVDDTARGLLKCDDWC